ncbi:MAG: tetratricopeptide repeat protein [Cyanobacteria bacterium RUI128]|nr:tetratricopeptide repeat protein [Cyanobacteria bacterium RUI128]
MSDKKVEKKGILKEVVEKISRANVIVDEYNKMGITPAMPGNAFINIATSMYTQGFYNEAENLLQSAICFPTKTSNALINLGVIKQTTGNFDEAINYYRSAFEQDQKNVKALGLWGNCLAMKGMFNEAIDKYREGIEIDDKNADIYLSWGALLIKKKKYREAKEKLELAIEYNQKDARPAYMLSIVQIELEEYDEALVRLMRIIVSTDNNFEALHNIAYIYFKKKNYDEAISYAKQVLSIFRHKVETYLLLGDIYAIKNMEDESLQFYEMAEMNGLKTFFLYISWAVSLQKFNRHEEAIEKLHKSNECLKNRNVDEVYARLALSYYKTGNIELSLQNRDKALEINPNNYMANSISAEIEVDKKNYELAMKYLEKCKDDFSNKGFNYSLQAQCHEGLGRTEGVRELYEKAVEYMPDKKEILMAYTNFLIKQNDYETAKKKIKSFAENSEDKDVLERYFDILYSLAKQGGYKYNVEQAIKVADKLKTFNTDTDMYAKEKEELEELLRNYE